MRITRSFNVEDMVCCINDDVKLSIHSLPGFESRMTATTAARVFITAPDQVNYDMWVTKCPYPLPYGPAVSNGKYGVQNRRDG